MTRPHNIATFLQMLLVLLLLPVLVVVVLLILPLPMTTQSVLEMTRTIANESSKTLDSLKIYPSGLQFVGPANLQLLNQSITTYVGDQHLRTQLLGFFSTTFCYPPVVCKASSDGSQPA